MLRLLAIFLWLVSFVPIAAANEGTRVERMQISHQADGWYLDADIRVELNSQLRGVAERGLSLYFTADLVVSEPRWWWFDRTVVEAERLWSISYNALIRQWRVSTGGLALPVASLDEALEIVRHIRGWRFANADALDPADRYEGRLRLRLDVSQLSRPFQVNAMNSSAWALATPWAPFRIRPDLLETWQP
ncbi:MAG: DUF4390 domain-containing protein [Pigmentiphaga sp.]|nr:DUF4390 domain-containing protein [Pigmentiphaga sp.]